MARNSRFDQDRAGSPGFPRQSDPIGPSAASGTPRHAASRSASGHRAEILDFDRLSRARHGVNEADQNASFSALVSSRTRQVGSGSDRRHQAHASTAVASHAQGNHHTNDRHQQAKPSAVANFFSRFMPAKDGAKESADRTAQGGEVKRTGRNHHGQDAKKKGFTLPFHVSFDWIRSSRPAQVSAIVCACLILGCAFVYPSAKDAYTAVRNADQAEAEYQAVLNRNDEIQSRINTLQTDEGIEDLARNSYGYVMSGEHSVRVSGLGDQSIAADAENQTPAIASGSVAPPETWYSPVLDVVFGYTPDNATTSTTDDSTEDSTSNE